MERFVCLLNKNHSAILVWIEIEKDIGDRLGIFNVKNIGSRMSFQIKGEIFTEAF